jgi:hypothetical protein
MALRDQSHFCPCSRRVPYARGGEHQLEPSLYRAFYAMKRSTVKQLVNIGNGFAVVAKQCSFTVNRPSTAHLDLNYRSLFSYLVFSPTSLL